MFRAELNLFEYFLMTENNNREEPFNTKALKNGDAELFGEMYRFYYAKLCYYAYSFVYDKDASKDIVHDVFSNIWIKRNKLQQIESLKFYLYRAVKNKSLDYLKHSGLNKLSISDYEQEGIAGNQNVEREYEHAELAGIIKKLLDELPPKCREVFVLVKFQGFKYAEAAELLGISSNTVENHIVKAFNFLRGKLSSSI